MHPETSRYADDITDVSGIRVGHHADTQAKTGVTVILPPGNGAPAGVHIGGNASSTRQFDSLKPYHVVDRIHALCFTGGSAFGLDAGGGVLTYLAEHGIGFPVVGQTIPIAPTAAIFDLNFGDGSVRPDSAMAYQACRNLSPEPGGSGSIGAGTGATVGKLFGVEQGMKGGLGTASVVSGDLVVGALVVVNAYGDIIDAQGNILAGARKSPTSMEPADATALLKNGQAASRRISVENTTLAVVAVNAAFDKLNAVRIAAQAGFGLARAIRPFHTHIDGDLTVAISAGNASADFNRIGLLAADALQEAVIKAVSNADGLGMIPAWKDRQPA